MSRHGLHVNQDILGAVQLGACSAIDDTNPYEPEDKKRYLGWKQGHKRAVEERQQQKRWSDSSWFCKLMCKLGIHRCALTRVPGRPHIDWNTGLIDRRDPIISKYTCVCCGDVHFEGLYHVQKIAKRSWKGR